jgi:hypothetical protein
MKKNLAWIGFFLFFSLLLFGGLFLFPAQVDNAKSEVTPTTINVIALLTPSPKEFAASTPSDISPPPSTTPTSTPAEKIQPSPTITLTPTYLRIWFSSTVPQNLSASFNAISWLLPVENRTQADIRVELAQAEDDGIDRWFMVDWVYALVAPFPTIEDEVKFDDLYFLLEGGKTKNFLKKPFTDLPSWEIIPFDQLEPRWKVLRVDGISPLDRDFEASTYPLTIKFKLSGNGLAQFAMRAQNDPHIAQVLKGNRDASKITRLVLTGTTALVRYTAARMEANGVTYPARDIVSWLRDADLTHISNEVSFYPQCPPAIPARTELRFCSSPKYFTLLEYTGVDLVELTGNHLLDYGYDAFKYTLSLYQSKGIPYYGGGRNLLDARKPLFIEDHGNRFVFFGCNAVGPVDNWATDLLPGAATCDLDWMEAQIGQLRSQGFLPVVTFQHFEFGLFGGYPPQSAQKHDFNRMAEAGAVIVSGSQAHYPQTMTFINGNFVHYGLGNLFFDQMNTENRDQFIDRHVFYNGKYISTELLTAVLEDYARPRPMTKEERRIFLEKIFAASKW